MKQNFYGKETGHQFFDVQWQWIQHPHQKALRNGPFNHCGGGCQITGKRFSTDRYIPASSLVSF